MTKVAAIFFIVFCVYCFIKFNKKILTYQRGLEVAGLKEEDMPIV
jgi:hypothetical protein